MPNRNRNPNVTDVSTAQTRLVRALGQYTSTVGHHPEPDMHEVVLRYLAFLAHEVAQALEAMVPFMDPFAVEVETFLEEALEWKDLARNFIWAAENPTRCRCPRCFRDWKEETAHYYD